jgi:alkanesulfonate monooxygenase SsuD/methylene tetrahydromethanopterin reductase-like flavin-dependent oxidoreductase (luciferase family)
MAMNFGIFFELEVPETGYTERDMWHNALTQIEFAEKMGFDSAYSVEHHFNPGYSHSSCPEILFAAASQRTKTIRLGTGVQLLPIDHPVRTAEKIAAIDCLTDGRYDFGVGRGAFTPEFLTFDKPHAQGATKDLNRDLFFECIDIIKTCWTKNNFTYNGKFYKIPVPITVVPKPVQKPGPRMFAACGSPDSYEMYPRLGMHIMPQTAVTPLDQMAAQLPTAIQSWKKAGHDRTMGPLQINTLVPVHCAKTTKQAIDQMKPYEMWYFSKLIEFFTPKSDDERARHANLPQWWTNPNWDYVYGEKMVICGDPKDCIDTVKEFEAAGVNRLMCQFQVGGMPHTMVMEALRLWGEEVIPFFKSR